MYNNKNTATETMVNDYLVVHVRGEEVFKNHVETGAHSSGVCRTAPGLCASLRAVWERSRMRDQRQSAALRSACSAPLHCTPGQKLDMFNVARGVGRDVRRRDESPPELT